MKPTQTQTPRRHDGPATLHYAFPTSADPRQHLGVRVALSWKIFGAVAVGACHAIDVGA